MKKGISPLIATVMLVMLAVILGFLFFKLSGRTIGTGLERGSEVWEGFQSCGEVSFKLLEFTCQGCRFALKISNNKDINFKNGFAVRAFYNREVVEGVSVPYHGNELLAYEARDIGGFLPGEDVKNPLTGMMECVPKPINSIEVIPKVKIGEEFKLCMDKKQVLEVVGCSEEGV